jgi:NADH-quinone oxidoreductase subunit K
MPLEAYLTLAAVLFCILMLNAVNINLIALARFRGDVTGMVFTVFTICITVSEAALGLAIVILLFRIRRTVIADHLDLLKG